MKLVEGSEVLVGDDLLGLTLLELLCEVIAPSAWMDAQSDAPTTHKPFSFMRSLILVRT